MSRRVQILRDCISFALFFALTAGLDLLLRVGIWLVIVVAIASALWMIFNADWDDRGDASWVHRNLDGVPYVITQPEARGHVLPWYRRAFAPKPKAEQDTPPPLTYRS